MSERQVNIDRETPMLFPVDMREWLPENHLVHFVVDAVEYIDTRTFRVNKRGTGDEQYPPDMMLALLIYSYATGRFGSRKIEAATYTDVAVMYICGGKAHPDHSAICDFRKNNRAAFEDTFTKVLLMARKLGKLKKAGGISVDGTKIHANASKHKAVSYRRAKELISEIEGEVKELVKKAEEADNKPLKEGFEIPEEIGRREERKAALEAACAEMEAEYKAAAAEAEQGKEAGKKGGKVKPLEEYQHNFTDPESRIMKAGNGNYFEQSYNAEAAVDTEGSMLIVGGYVTAHGNDKKELEPSAASVDKEIREASTVAADAGFYSEEGVRAVERRDAEGKLCGPEVYCAVEKTSHGRKVKDLEAGNGPVGRIPQGMTAKERMGRKLRTEKGKAVYKKRKETVEPVFGIIKSAMGFRQFMLRGLKKVNCEWVLVRAAYNIRRLRRLLDGIGLPQGLVFG